MDIEDFLHVGNKVQISLGLYEHELETIDALCAKHNCSRAEVVGAWSKMFEHIDLTGKVKPGRRPGGGRKPNGRT